MVKLVKWVGATGWVLIALHLFLILLSIKQWN